MIERIPHWRREGGDDDDDAPESAGPYFVIALTNALIVGVKSPPASDAKHSELGRFEEREEFALTDQRIQWTWVQGRSDGAGRLERASMSVRDFARIGLNRENRLPSPACGRGESPHAARPARKASTVCITPHNSARPLRRPMKE